MQGADDPARDRVLVAVGIADRDDRFARHQIGRRAQRYHRQRTLRVDLDDRQVGFQVAGQQLGDVPAAVGQGDDDFMDALDDVVVGDDVAAGIDHHAGAHAVDAAAGLGSGRLSVGRRGGDGFFAADVHHRAPHALNRLDDRRFAQFGGRGAGPEEQAPTATQRDDERPAAAALTRNEMRGSIGHGMSVAGVDTLDRSAR